MRLVEAGTIERAIGIHIEDYPPFKLESGKSVGGEGHAQRVLVGAYTGTRSPWTQVSKPSRCTCSLTQSLHW